MKDDTLKMPDNIFAISHKSIYLLLCFFFLLLFDFNIGLKSDGNRGSLIVLIISREKCNN